MTGICGQPMPDHPWTVICDRLLPCPLHNPTEPFQADTSPRCPEETLSERCTLDGDHPGEHESASFYWTALPSPQVGPGQTHGNPFARRRRII
jgi:hypothetical protein